MSTEGRFRGLLLIREHLHLAGAGVVVAADMEHLVACAAALLVAVPGHAVASPVEVGELLGIKVQQVAGRRVLLAVIGLLGLESRGLGDAGPAERETHGGAGNAEVSGDADGRLALPP